MQYRKFGQLDWNVSALGFGCMRLPLAVAGGPGENIDEAESTRMIRRAIDDGLNYLDTAYVYHGGNSEVVLGKALLDGYRDRVRIATKSPVWSINEPSDFDKYLNEQLIKLQTDHIDFYLLHALGAQSWENTILKHDVLNHAEAAIRDGRIRHLGFSFHDNYDAFETIVNGYDKWTFCQIQYNYMDVENQAGTKGLKLAASKGLAVVVMEPLLGGRLAVPPTSIRQMFTENDSDRSPADWALQWLWSQPEVSVVLSGMSEMTQVEQNLRSAHASGANAFTTAQRNVIEQVQEAYRARVPIPCTQCGYCMPCPSGLDIPRIFSVFNHANLHEDVEGARNLYNWQLKAEQRAVNCASCQECEDKCPQKIHISEWMPRVNAVLAEGAAL